MVLATILTAPFFIAAEPETPTEANLPDVVVTARKRAENEQTVPGSISVRSAEQLAAIGAVDLRYASTGIPNITLGTFAARRLTFPYVRGIGSGQNAPGVTTYVDGVPQLSNMTANQELLGVERIEFLRGPQSAMYGGNSLGGVINVIPRLPPAFPERQLSFAAGNYGYHEGRLVIEGPLCESGVLFSLEGRYAARDGYSENYTTGNDLDYREAWAGRVQLYLPDQGDWNFRLSLTSQRDRDGGYVLYDLDSIRSNPHRVSHDFAGYNHRDLAQPVFTARRHGDNADFVSITAWQWWQTSDSTDLDYTPADLLRKEANEDARAWIQEWRLSSPAEDPIRWGDRMTIHWLAGLFAFHEETSRRDVTDYRPGGTALGLWPAQFTTQSDTNRENTGASIFGHTALTLDQRWELGLGLRYDYQYRSAEMSSRIPQGPTMAQSDQSRNFDQVSPRISLSYHLSPEMLIYTDAAQGYRAGGFNPIAPPDHTSYNQETSINLETGVKTAWMENRLVFNAALFHTDWDDIQVNTHLPGGSPSDYYVANAGKARSRGAEFEIRTTPWRPVTLFAGAGLLDTRYRSGSQSAGEEVGGNKLPFAPRLTWQTGLDYSHSLSRQRRGFVRTEIVGSSGYEYDASNRESQGSHALVNLGLGMITGPWRATGWIRNVFDRKTEPLAIPYGQDAQGQPLYIGESGAPRTFGISLARAF